MKENKTGRLLSTSIVYSFGCILPRFFTYKSPLGNGMFSDI